MGGDAADIMLVYACTDPTAGPKKRLTVFIVEREMGVKTDYLYNLMGCHGGGTARVVFDNIWVPDSAVLGEVNGAYDVYEEMMIPERFGTAAMTIGAVRPALEVATDYTGQTQGVRPGNQPLSGRELQGGRVRPDVGRVPLLHLHHRPCGAGC